MLRDPCDKSLTRQQQKDTAYNVLLDATLTLADLQGQLRKPSQQILTDSDNALQLMQSAITQPVAQKLQQADASLRTIQQTLRYNAINDLGNVAYTLDQLEKQYRGQLPHNDNGDVDYDKIANVVPGIQPDSPAQMSMSSVPGVSATQSTLPIPQQPQVSQQQSVGGTTPTQTVTSPSKPDCPPTTVNVHCPPVAGQQLTQSPVPGYPPADQECNVWNRFAWISDKCGEQFLNSISNLYGDSGKQFMAANGMEASKSAMNDIYLKAKG